MQTESITVKVGMMDNNCYLVTETNSGETLVIDPGFDSNRILAAMKGRSPVGIVLTHGHFDHCNLVDELRAVWGVPLWIHTDDAGALNDGTRNASLSLLRQNIVYEPAERTFSDGDSIPFGSAKLTVIHTPGHTAGCCCFYQKEANALFTGDTVLCGSVGRTDLATGDMRQMMASVGRLKAFGKSHPDTRILPGHGCETSFAEELRRNPYFQ